MWLVEMKKKDIVCDGGFELRTLEAGQQYVVRDTVAQRLQFKGTATLIEKKDGQHGLE